MSDRTELLSVLKGRASSEGADDPTGRRDQLAWVQAGIAALEARLDAPEGPTTAADRTMMVTLLLSLEDGLQQLAAESPTDAAADQPTIEPPVAQLEAHLAVVGQRIRSRVVYSDERPKRSASFLRVLPGVRPPATVSWPSLAGRILTVLGITISAFLVFEFLLTSLFHDRSQQDLLASFKQSIHSTTLDSPTSSPTVGSPVAILEIPRIGVQQVVVEGTTPEDLKLGPGHLRAAPLPGEFGNAVIAGRRTTYGAPFKALNLLRVGDTIRVTTGQGVFVYLVASVRSIAAGQAGPLTATLDNRLTLITSDPPFMPSRRLVVVAHLGPLVAAGDTKGTPVAVSNRPPVAASITELGLAGDPSGLIGTLLFGQLLALGIWLTAILLRRWPPSLVLLFALPTLLALSILTFSSVDRLLPGML